MAQDHYYADLNMHLNQVKEHVLETFSNHPGTGTIEGRVIYITGNKPYYYNGLSWQEFGKDNLVDLLDTDISSATDDQLLSFDSNSNKWVARTVDSGIQVNNPEITRVLTSGSTAGSNLEAQSRLLFKQESFEVEGSDYVMGLITKTSRTIANASLGIYGSRGNFLPSLTPYAAGMEILASEVHTASSLGTRVVLVNTKKGFNNNNMAFMINDDGNVIIKPVNAAPAQTEVDFFVNGAIGSNTKLVKTTTYDIDSGQYKDSVIIVNPDVNMTVNLYFPLPTIEQRGRKITVKLASYKRSVTVNLTTKSSATPSFYASGTAVTSLSFFTDGEAVELICAETDTGYLWYAFLKTEPPAP